MEIKRLNEGSETWNAKTGACTSAEIPFYIMQPGSKADAIQALLAAAPGTYSGLPLKEIRFEGYDAGGNMDLTAVYSERESSGGDDDEGEEATESFDCGGGTKHMTHAISQTRVYGGSGDDAGGGIGWNGKSGSEAEFSGVDVPCADMRETYTKTMSRSKVTGTSYKKKVAALVGKVNAGTFKGWSAGEIMFLGMSFSTPSKGAKKVTVTFNFRVMPNESRCKVAGKDVGSKKGFEYLWARSETKDGGNGYPEVQVNSIYKSIVCESANFGALGL